MWLWLCVVCVWCVGGWVGGGVEKCLGGSRVSLRPRPTPGPRVLTHI